MHPKRIALFGSTGSIGKQALEVIAGHPDQFSVEILTANNNDALLIEQALEHNPNIVVIGDEQKYSKVREALSGTDIKVFAGEKAIEVGKAEKADTSGLEKRIADLKAGKN